MRDQLRRIRLIASCGFLLFTLAGPASALPKSLKAADWMPGSSSDIGWLTDHYAWIDSTPTPLRDWYALNPALKTDVYFAWVAMNFMDDPPAGSPVSDQTWVWYDYCAKRGLDWDDGFYHLATADTYLARTLDSAGQSLDAKIRYLLLNTSATNCAAAGWAGTASLSLAGAGDALYFGRLDRFDELNLQFAMPAAPDWQGRWEYWDGTSWAALPLTTDTTQSAQQDGTIRFDPPTARQWRRTKVNGVPTVWGEEGVYFVRLHVVAAGSGGPVVKLAQGRHYWVHNGAAGNTVPAWDPASDVDRDDYAEAALHPNATARFKYESRIPDLGWAWSLAPANISDRQFRRVLIGFTIDALDRMADGSSRYTGARLDSASGDTFIPVAAQDKVLEYPGLTSEEVRTRYRADWATIVREGRAALNGSGYLLGGNVGHTGYDEVNAEFDFHMREDALDAGRIVSPGYWGNWEEKIWPADSQWQKWSDAGKFMLWQWQLRMYNGMGDAGKTVQLTGGSTTATGVGTHWLETVEPGSVLYLSIAGQDYFLPVASVESDTSCTLSAPWSGSDYSGAHTMLLARDKYEGLAAFLALQNPATDYFSMWWGYYYSSAKAPYLNWLPAEELDYGTPTGVVPPEKEARGTRGAYVYATGPDPVSGRPYFIYARDYTNALILLRPLTGGSDYTAQSAIPVDLPQPMQLVDYWGNVGLPVSRITLRNAEAAILLPSSAAPALPRQRPRASWAPDEAPAERVPAEGARVVVRLAVDKASAAPGQVVTYTLVCRNLGTEPASSVVVTNTLPDEVTYLPGTTTLEGRPVSPDPVIANRLSLSIGTLPAGAAVEITLRVRVR